MLITRSTSFKPQSKMIAKGSTISLHRSGQLQEHSIAWTGLDESINCLSSPLPVMILWYLFPLVTPSWLSWSRTSDRKSMFCIYTSGAVQQKVVWQTKEKDEVIYDLSPGWLPSLSYWNIHYYLLSWGHFSQTDPLLMSVFSASKYWVYTKSFSF